MLSHFDPTTESALGPSTSRQKMHSAKNCDVKPVVNFYELFTYGFSTRVSPTFKTKD